MAKWVLVKVIDETWVDAVVWMGQNSGVDAAIIDPSGISQEVLDRFEVHFPSAEE